LADDELSFPDIPFDKFSGKPDNNCPGYKHSKIYLVHRHFAQLKIPRLEF